MTTLNAIKLAFELETGQRDRPLHYAKALSDGIKEKTPRWEKPYGRMRTAFSTSFFRFYFWTWLILRDRRDGEEFRVGAIILFSRSIQFGRRSFIRHHLVEPPFAGSI
jgi:hypothetical protein